jgi:hypothetical protein
MEIEEILVIIVSIILGVLNFLLLKKLSKKRTIGAFWATPFFYLIGWWFQWETGNGDTFLEILYSTLLWAFLLFMIIVNFKMFTSGSILRWKLGKDMFTNLKSSALSVRDTFRNKEKLEDLEPITDEECEEKNEQEIETVEEEENDDYE